MSPSLILSLSPSIQNICLFYNFSSTTTSINITGLILPCLPSNFYSAVSIPKPPPLYTFPHVAIIILCLPHFPSYPPPSPCHLYPPLSIWSPFSCDSSVTGIACCYFPMSPPLSPLSRTTNPVLIDPHIFQILCVGSPHPTALTWSHFFSFLILNLLNDVIPLLKNKTKRVKTTQTPFNCWFRMFWPR